LSGRKKIVRESASATAAWPARSAIYADIAQRYAPMYRGICSVHDHVFAKSCCFTTWLNRSCLSHLTLHFAARFRAECKSANHVAMPSVLLQTCIGLNFVFLRVLHKGYDTIRDAILTCSRKPICVSLIYRTEPTTKKCKTEKVKSKNGYAQK